MITLTRPLLERYLRATGHTALPWIAEALDDGARAPDLVEQISGSGHEFRLGLCAAAEMMRARIADLVLRYDARDRMAVNVRDELIHQRDELLRGAGIDPAAWEAAR